MQRIANLHKNDISKYIIGQYGIDKYQKTENYYEFGKLFYSQYNDVENKSITWHFPFNELRPNELIYNLPEDIYPTIWSVLGSNDGINWTELIYSNTSMCPESRQYPIYGNGVIYKYYCQRGIVVFPFENTKPYKYLKYIQYNNSYILQNRNKYSIINYGVDFGGIFTTDYYLCTYYNLYSSIHLTSLSLYCLILL